MHNFPCAARHAWPHANALAHFLASASLVLAVLLATAAHAEPLSLTTTARLLAGVPPDDADPAVADIVADDAWQQHRKAARAGGRQLKARLAHMHDWQTRYLPDSARGGTLLYPFSGPDFINAYALFPEADTYVFFSLEAVGEVPPLDQLDEKRRAELFGDLRAALNDLVALNFFITPNMKERLQTEALQGTIPVLLAQLGLLDMHVESVERIDPWPERTRKYAAPGGKHPALLEQGVRIVFSNGRTQRRQALEYLALDVSDHELHYYPEFIDWLKSFPQPAVLLKSASYLLHGEHFRVLRKALLADAQLIVQDDTGFPFNMVKEAGFSVALFGQYEHPVKLFESRYQPDLEAAYDGAGKLDALPFPFGYNWRKEGKSGLLVAVRPGAPH